MAETRSMLLNEAVVRETEVVLGRLEQAIAERNQQFDKRMAELREAIQLFSDQVNHSSSCGHLQQKRSSPVVSMTPETPDHYLQHKNSGICMIDNDVEDRFLSDSAFVENEIEKDLVEIDVAKSSDDNQLADAGDVFGFNVEVSESDLLFNQSHLIQEQAKKNYTDLILETSLLQQRDLILTHQVSPPHWEISRRSSMESMDVNDESKAFHYVYDDLPSAIVRTHQWQSQFVLEYVGNIACQVFDIMSLGTSLLQSKRRKTFLKTWWFKFKATSQPRELIQGEPGIQELNKDNSFQDYAMSVCAKKLLSQRDLVGDTDFVLEMVDWCEQSPSMKTLLCAHQLVGKWPLMGQRMMKKEKILKCWKFKFKPDNVDIKQHHNQVFSVPAFGIDMWVIHHEEKLHVVNGFVVIVLFRHSTGLSIRLQRKTLQDLQKFTIGVVLFLIKHKWRFKFLHSASELVLYFDSLELSTSYANLRDCLWTRGSSTGRYEYFIWEQNDKRRKPLCNRRLIDYKLGSEPKTVARLYQCVDQLVKMELAKEEQMLEVTQSQTFDPGIRLESKATCCIDGFNQMDS
ncbi:hypothetical protein ISN45_Aa06g016450 [Arabidopsis thaliana x Arabidopsis arenosa]|uniref:Uncharacterized protein n=1 Tax=Arabidopsis thaliana x Arabidopsis arenosa TaxID=1240361 RepID=A0A8T1YWU1_9BRAS|nr:hypothetical protein ISN45_Aa06g016450 [Arabidopsis thaliana x Arabidopsis arenosa]